LDGGAALGNDFAGFRKSLDLANDLGRDEARASRFAAELEKSFERIRSFSVRETKSSSGLKLPDKVITNIEVDLEPRQSEIYRQFRDELAATVVQDGQAVLDDAEGLLKRLLRLVQVASHPAMVDQAYRAVPGKIPVLASLLH